MNDMALSPASFGFDLNNREIATLVYLGLLLAVILLWKNGRPFALNVVRAFFSPKLALIWLLMSLYVASSVWLLACLKLWDWPNLKSALLWWLLVGFTCIFEAQKLKDKPQLLGKLVRDAFKISVLVIFIAELVSFPLWVEMLLLPTLVFLSLLITVGEYQADKPGMLRLLSLLRGIQVFGGLLILGCSYWLVASSITEFVLINTLRELALPIFIWIMFIPFIFILAVFMTYEESFIHLKMRPKQAAIVRYARWRALFAFGWNIDGVKRLTRDIRERDITDVQGIIEAIHEIKRLLKIEKKPPVVTRSEGWSPYAARLFLLEYGLVAGDYHRTLWDWSASIPSVKLSEKVFADRVSYYLHGNESAVTQMRLTLDGSKQEDMMEAEHAFNERALTLLAKAIDADQAMEIYALAQNNKPEPAMINDTQVSLDRSDWGDPVCGGYALKLVVQHSKHVIEN